MISQGGEPCGSPHQGGEGLTEAQRELGADQMKQDWDLGVTALEDKAPVWSARDHDMGEIMQDSSVREMSGRRSLCWRAQAVGLVWEQGGLCRRWQNKERREPGAHQTGKKSEKEEAVKEGGKWI